MATLRKVTRSTTVTKKTYLRLLKAITQNLLLPGQALVIEALGQELGVSRTPVREALLLLEKDGLVELVNGRGFYVAGLTTNDLNELFDIREAIELMAVRRTIELDRVHELHGAREALASYLQVEEDDLDNAAEAELAFHKQLVASSGNGRMLDTWNSVASQLRRFWADGRLDSRRVKNDIRECLAVMDSLLQGDGDVASERLSKHLLATRRSFGGMRSLQTKESSRR